MNAAEQGGKTFITHIPVRFGDCDAAGIVFYPRYFEMINGVVEDWCAQALGMPFREMHLQHRLGIPAVRIETDFSAPSELGELLQGELRLERLGSSSFTLSVRLLGPDGGPRLQARLVLVLMDLERRRPAPMPDALRAAMAACLDPTQPDNPPQATERQA